MSLNSTYSLSPAKLDFQTNVSEDYIQYSPDVVGLSNGGFAFVNLNDYPLFTGLTFLDIDFYDANFQPIANATQHTAARSYQTVQAPSITQLTNGNVLVVWEDNDPVSSDVGLRGKLFTSTGTPVGTAELLLAGVDDLNFDYPKVAALTGGGFAMSYSYGSALIWYARYNASGTLLSTDLVKQSLSGPVADSSIAGLADGEFVVTYSDSNATSAGWNIRASVYNADGSPRARDFSIDTGFQDQTQSEVVGLSNGNFVVVYTNAGNNEGGTLGNGISLWVYDKNGVPKSFAHVNVTSAVDETDPDVTALPNGFFVVTWTKPYSSTEDDIYGRVFDQNGSPVTIDGSSTEFVLASKSTNENESKVSNILGSKFITTWHDTLDDGFYDSIHSTIRELFRFTVGSGANDTFVGDQLHDTFTGGAGDDRFVYAPGGGGDVWTDFAAGVGTPDRVDLTAFNMSFATVTSLATQSGSDTLLNFGNGDVLTLRNVAKGNLVPGDFYGLRTKMDFDTDGHSDLLWRDNSGANAVWEMNDNGTIKSYFNITTVDASYKLAGSGDFDGDGHGDLLWRNSSGVNAVWEMNSNGSIKSYFSLPTVDPSYHLAGMGDFDGDGKTDLIWRNTVSGANAVWEMTGDANNPIKAYFNIPTVDPSYKLAGLGDFDGNGITDLVWRNSSSGVNAVWEMNNNGTIKSYFNLPTVDPSYSLAGVGDFDGDGHADLLWRSTSGVNAVWLMNSNGIKSFANIPTVDPSYNVEQISDFDGDSQADILWRNTAGTNAVWEMNGAAIKTYFNITSVDPSYHAVGTHFDVI